MHLTFLHSPQRYKQAQESFAQIHSYPFSTLKFDLDYFMLHLLAEVNQQCKMEMI